MTVLRSLGRGVAHHRVNKHGRSNDKAVRSFFSEHWKDYLQRTKQ